MSWLKRLVGGGPTELVTEDFALHLPEAWRPDHEDDHFGFVRQAANEQITLSVLLTREPLDKPTLLVAALDLVRARQEALRAVSQGRVTVGDVTTVDRGAGMDVTFMAADTTHGLQASVTVFARPRRLVTMSYNKYAPLLPEADFTARADGIRSSLTVR